LRSRLVKSAEDKDSGEKGRSERQRITSTESTTEILEDSPLCAIKLIKSGESTIYSCRVNPKHVAIVAVFTTRFLVTDFNTVIITLLRNYTLQISL
jgi:hypothetical protein